MKKTFILIITAVVMTACASRKDDSAVEWSVYPDSIHGEYADVIWFSGTVVSSDKDTEGHTLHRISLSDDHKKALKKDAGFAKAHLFPDSVNMFSPYYHQFTLECIYLGKEQFDSVVAIVADEAYSIFHEYMQRENGGRPYVLAGMSQGAMMVREILKRMTDEEYERMRAAYILGFGLSADDLRCKHIKPAQGESDRGVCISYNSVAAIDGIWPTVYNNAAVCMNPVTWRNDTTPGTFVWKDDTLTVRKDSVYNVLIISGEKKPLTVGLNESWNKNNRHLQDYFNYESQIRRNVLDRIYR